MKPYPKLSPDNPSDVPEILRYMIKERGNDIKDFDNLTNTFMSGRKVGIIPTGAATSSSDRIGDYNADGDYFYLVVPFGSTSEWRRVAWTAW